MWHLKTLRKVEVVVQVFPFFFCSGLRVSFYYMLNPLNEKQYDWSVKMFWQGCTFFKCLWEAVLISLLTYSWGETDILVYETFINRKTYWDNDKLARVHDRARWDTQTSTPVPTRKSTKKEKKGLVQGHLLVPDAPQSDKSASLCTFCIIPSTSGLNDLRDRHEYQCHACPSESVQFALMHVAGSAVLKAWPGSRRRGKQRQDIAGRGIYVTL